MVDGVNKGDSKKELSLANYQVGKENHKPEKDATTNFFRQQPIFTQAKEKTLATPEIDEVYAFINDDDATKRDLQAFDIAARPYNISGFKVMKNSDMFRIFSQINAGDFSEGVNDRGEPVLLFDNNKSDGKIKMFSTEKDNEGNIYYAIKDSDGKTYKFTEDGKLF